jgi:TPP-dependent indolepyruvate ferredoxin oxidoreductase alpha subunit
MIINGRDLDSDVCEICSECHSHFWCSLIGWVDRKKPGDS